MDNRTIQDDEIDLLDYWRILTQRKCLFFVIVGTALAVSIAASLLLPKIYRATASLLPPEEHSSAADLISSKLSGGFGGLASGVLRVKSPTDRWIGILNSRTVFDGIISQFHLKEVYQEEILEDARERLRQAVTIDKSREAIVSIQVEDKNPERAAEIANAFVEALDRTNREIGITAGGRMRIFLEARLQDAKVALTNSEEALKVFQEKNGAVKLDAQSEAVIGAIGDIKGKLMAKEVALETILSYATPQNPQVKILKTEVKELRSALIRLEKGDNTEKALSGSIFIPTTQLPGLSLQYVRLLRDAKIDETLYGLLSEQYEMARIQEAKDNPTLQVLDIASVSKKEISPKKGLIVVTSTLISIILACFVIFFMAYIEEAKASLRNRDAGKKTAVDLKRRRWGDDTDATGKREIRLK